MKKCFTTTVLLVVAVAMTMTPVGAFAPLIEDLPRVVISDSSAGITKQQVFDLEEYVDWSVHGAYSEFDYSMGKYHVYLYDAKAADGDTSVTATLKAGTSGGLANVSSLDYGVIAGGNQPSGSANDLWAPWGGRYWLSLLSKGTDQTVDMSLIATVDDLLTGPTNIKLTEAALTVIIDGSASEDQVQYRQSFHPDEPYADDFSNWTSTVDPSGPASPMFFNGLPAYNANDIPGGAFSFGTWFARDSSGWSFFIPHEAGGLTNPVFEARMTLGATDQVDSFTKCPGYRLRYGNASECHYGTFSMDETEEYVPGVGSPYTMPLNAPFGGDSFEGRLYWATPYTANDMGDSGYIAAAGDRVTWTSGSEVFTWRTDYGIEDGRDYSVFFDVVDRLGDEGTIYLESVSIRTFDEGPNQGEGDDQEDLAFSNPVQWIGTAATASTFAIYENTFWGGFSALDPTWNDGKVENDFGNEAVKIFADSMTLPRPVVIGWWRAVACAPVRSLDLAKNFPMEANKLVRVSLGLSTTWGDLCPPIRLQMSPTAPITGGATGYENVDRHVKFFEYWGANSTTFKTPGLRDSGQPNPGTVPEAGGVFHSYFWTHENASDAVTGEEYLQPNLTAFTQGRYAAIGSGDTWLDEYSPIVLTSVKIEDADAIADLNDLDI